MVRRSPYPTKPAFLGNSRFTTSAGNHMDWSSILRMRNIPTALCLIVFSLFLLFTFSFRKATLISSALSSESNPVYRYGIMFDAGSTGSRIHVYKFLVTSNGLEINDEVFEQLKPGLSSYVGNPEAAAKSLEPLVEAALKSVPENQRKCTPMALKATAGLRLTGEMESKEILEAVERYLKSTPFHLVENGVGIMDGMDEGIFAWITVNYLLDRLGRPEKLPTAGIMDLGGGSTQIVFEPKSEYALRNAPREHVYEMMYGKHKYTLYQHSFLGYGLMEARKKLMSIAIANNGDTACLPNGWIDEETKIRGADNNDFNQCYQETKMIFNKDASCTVGPCAFNGVFMPSYEEFCDELFAFSYFYDRTEHFITPFPPTLTLNDYKILAEDVCDETYDSRKWGEELSKNPHLCLDICFLYGLLNEGYNIPAAKTDRKSVV